MHFHKNERVAIFIDGANLHATARALGFEVDFRRLLVLFQQCARLVRASYYTPLSDEEASNIKPLLDWLAYNGYNVVTKPVMFALDGDGCRRARGSMEIDLAVDALVLAASVDHIVLFSGDGDFRCLVAVLQERGKRVSVVSTLQSQPPMVADELRRQADQFVELLDLRADLGRTRPAARI
jgi:uncharacterized LabA/DUF88 family protein